MEVSPTNKNASVVGGYYLSAVERYGKGTMILNYLFTITMITGCPRLISADLGSENARIAYLQPFLRRNGTDTLAGSESFRYGKSVHNQVYIIWVLLLESYLRNALTSQENRAMVENYASVVHTVVDRLLSGILYNVIIQESIPKWYSGTQKWRALWYGFHPKVILKFFRITQLTFFK